MRTPGPQDTLLLLLTPKPTLDRVSIVALLLCFMARSLTLFSGAKNLPRTGPAEGGGGRGIASSTEVRHAWVRILIVPLPCSMMPDKSYDYLDTH